MNRFVSEAEYIRLTGLSRPTVRKGIIDGAIPAVRTEAGHYRIRFDEVNISPEAVEVIGKLEGIESVIKALCKQFNVEIPHKQKNAGVSGV